MSFTCEALHAVKLSEQLIDNSVSDTSRVVPPLRGYGIKLVKEEHTGSSCRSSPATIDMSAQERLHNKIRAASDVEHQPVSVSSNTASQA